MVVRAPCKKRMRPRLSSSRQRRILSSVEVTTSLVVGKKSKNTIQHLSKTQAVVRKSPVRRVSQITSHLHQQRLRWPILRNLSTLSTRLRKCSTRTQMLDSMRMTRESRWNSSRKHPRPPSCKVPRKEALSSKLSHLSQARTNSNRWLICSHPGSQRPSSTVTSLRHLLKT